jgi:Na+/proline symporter
MFGGVQAVTWADVKQMALIVGALFLIVVILIVQLPVTPDEALKVAGAAGRTRVFDFSFTLNEQYTFWSGIIGGTFLMLSYFGTDQSQVQRYLTARSVEEARSSLLMSAYWRIPLQALILLIGVLIFVFYLFRPAPLLFNPAHEQSVRAADSSGYALLEERYRADFEARRLAATALAAAPVDDAVGQRAFLAADSAVNAVRSEALTMATTVTGESSRDVNYVMPSFVLNHLPLGMAGIFIAAVMAAAMSSIAAELNSLSTATVIDFYRRWWKPGRRRSRTRSTIRKTSQKHRPQPKRRQPADPRHLNLPRLRKLKVPPRRLRRLLRTLVRSR